MAHTKWMCKYHIVFTPKYRRKVIYNQYKEDIRDIIKILCKYKGLEQEHCIQEDVFNMMHQRGLYPTPDADANKVENAKQKFSQCVKTV